MQRKFRWDKKYLHWGVTAFCVIAACVLFYMLLQNFSIVTDAVNTLMSIVTPFLWGLAFSYFLAPLMRLMEKKRMPGWLCLLICALIIIVVITALVYMIIPQLYSSIETIVSNSPLYIEKLDIWVDELLENHPELNVAADSLFSKLEGGLSTFLQEKIMPSMGNVLSSVTAGVVVVIKAVLNLVIGIIVSLYILNRLDKVKAGANKILYSVFTIEAAEKIREMMAFVDKTFKNFFLGKLLDSLIIGLLCYIFCALVNMPYALLVSVIVGITNIIPFFGPFIGAIPSAIIILMVSPVKCLIFVVFIIILQQIDGNVIGPKILGNSIGINGFWVMFAIIIGGGIFGFWGMLFGVPVFVCIYTGIRVLIRRKLKRSELPPDAAAYMNLDYIDPATREVHYKEEQQESNLGGK